MLLTINITSKVNALNKVSFHLLLVNDIYTLKLKNNFTTFVVNSNVNKISSS